MLRDGGLAGTWKAKVGRGGRLDFELERLAPLDRDELEQECTRVAKLRGADTIELTIT